MKKTLFILALFLILKCGQSNAQGCFCTLGITNFHSTPQGASKTVKLSWTSNGETPSGVSYNIEKSNNGTNFYLIETVNYQHVVTANYTFTDICGKPPTGVSPVFYRLTSLGIDGTTKVSNIVLANVSAQNPGTCYTSCQSSTGLTGPNNICSSSTGEYSMGFTSTPVTWQISGSAYATLTVGPIANKASITVNANVLNESITLTATLTGCATTFTKNIPIGTQNSLTGTYTTNTSTKPLQTVNFVTSGPIFGQFQWPFVSNISVTSSAPGFTTNGNTFSFTISSQQSVSVNFNGTGLCGAVNATRAFIQSGSRFAITASPNPAINNINVSVNKITDGSVRLAQAVVKSNTRGTTKMYLYNFNTRVLAKEWTYKEMHSINYNLNIAGIKSGPYILKMERNNETTSTKVIIQ